NGWSIAAIETKLEGSIAGLRIKGIADLVLERGSEKAIIDLKWRGAGWRQMLLKNEEDIQLYLYSNMLPPVTEWPHTAYFVINQGKLIARNNAAFRQAIAVSPDADTREVNQRIWEKMTKTLEWRRQQLRSGRIEVRCHKTAALLEDHYAEALTEFDLLDLLEMKEEDAAYDDYRTLINLIE
ncbi:MAG: PD-(D/E)XK nuclease family protein, partial [Phaeodactylibacter sp.]|nr:PD-(D/E)XK nuclease family protein [Phaeodactylibacter sp.]